MAAQQTLAFVNGPIVLLLGDVVAVVERVRDDGRGHLEHELAKRCVLGSSEFNAGVVEQVHERGLVDVLAGLTAWEEPGVVAVGRGVEVRQLIEVSPNNICERLWYLQVVACKADADTLIGLTDLV